MTLGAIVIEKKVRRSSKKPVRKRTDGADSRNLVKTVDQLHKYVKSNLRRFDQQSLRHSIRKVLEIYAALDMQRDVRNEQGRSGSGTHIRKQ